MLSAARRLALQPHARALSTRAPGSANLDWSNLGFTARDVNTYVCYNHKDGAWQGPTFSDDGYIKIHALSNALNYGQAVFEGLKVLQTRSGAVCAFNPAANHTRLQNSCKRLLMPDVPRELFFEGIETAVRKNADFVPPCGTGGSLYVRPLIFGHGAQLGLGAAPEFALIFAVCPVGAYYKGGLEGVDALVVSDYDRAAPLGVGHVKCAGNYAPDVLPSKLAKERGFSVCLYLDPQTRTFIEEFSTSNFLGVTADGTLVAPSSPSVLPSCTKQVVLQAARDMGIAVEERPVPWTEVRDLKEVAACGTAVVLTPMRSITYGNEVVSFDGFATIERLYEHVCALQVGDAPDTHGILHEIKLQ